jgi:F-type H+-transporting ATPase subunit delta
MAQTSGYDIAAKRYAEAAFGIASDTATQDQWQDDLASLAELMRNEQAAAYLHNAKVRDEHKQRLLERALDISPLAMNLARLLLQRGRLALAPQISSEYDRMLDAARGIAHARVTTAVPLGEAEQRAVAERLRAMTGAHEVRLDARIDPSLIGGMVAQIGDQLVDGSTRTRLIELKRRLAGAVR